MVNVQALGLKAQVKPLSLIILGFDTKDKGSFAEGQSLLP
jgi:hypothetical protein